MVLMRHLKQYITINDFLFDLPQDYLQMSMDEADTQKMHSELVLQSFISLLTCHLDYPTLVLVLLPNGNMLW